MSAHRTTYEQGIVIGKGVDGNLYCLEYGTIVSTPKPGGQLSHTGIARFRDGSKQTIEFTNNKYK